MHPRIITALALWGALAAGGGGRFLAADVQPPITTLSVGGVSRSFILHVPRGFGLQPPVGLSPLVLVFHGGGGSARTMPRFTGFDALSDQEGFFVAYPDSFNRSWNDSRGLSPADDVGFVHALIGSLRGRYPIDPARVYATGISAGGFFSQRLACDLAGDVSAVAAVAATMPEPLLPICKPAQAVSVLFMHGVSDPIVRIEGGPVLRDRGNAVSLLSAVRFWRDFDGTAATSVGADLPDQVSDGTHVHRDLYRGGRQGTEVVVYTIAGGGHTWPGGSQYLPAFFVGKASGNLDATSTIWEFFKAHARR
jgi:polyhydroxybutyrate depolymerase